MSVHSFLRGHPIEYVNNQWLYSDTKKPADDSRACTRCGRHPTPEGHDACLGKLEGVTAACCGHGITQGAIIREEAT